MARGKITAKPVIYASTGRRKTAIARVRLMTGKGNIIVNERPVDKYFGRKMWEILAKQPFVVSNTLGKFDVIARTTGGGIAGQAGALRHGIARALVQHDETLRPALKKAGLLTRDPREKERKKYGRKRARRGFQWTKR